MNTYIVIDNNLNVVLTGTRFECEAWVAEFGWNNEAYYSIRPEYDASR
jgi:hypothetical protein